jgi:CRP-like cAMP-binding protein
MAVSNEAPASIHNHILCSLPATQYQRLLPQLEPVELPLGKILYEPYEPIQHVYFPNEGVISVVSMLESGVSIEVGVVGSEGMLGIPVVLGTMDEANRRSLVQIAGRGLRMRAETLRQEFKRGGRLHDLLLRYTHAFITQISQTAACNRIHHIDERLARWLLACRDRVRSDRLNLTQEFIAEMLGTRRAGVTVAAGRLQEQGVISYSRGKILILNRRRLEDFSCECYRIVRREFDRLDENGHHQ